MLQWTQGDKSGECRATNAHGLLASLKEAGVKVNGAQQDVEVKKGRFMRVLLPTLLKDSECGYASAPALEPTSCTLVLAMPKEHTPRR